MGAQWREIEVVARGQLPVLLGEVLGVPQEQVRVDPPSIGQDHGYDFSATAAGQRILLQVKSRGEGAPVVKAWAQLQRVAFEKPLLALVVVPFMGGPARDLCQKLGINWMDLSGNADIRAPGLRIHVEGRRNRFARTGRPPSVFERRGARLTRILLEAPERDWSVRESASASGLDEGQVSRIVGRLVEDGLLVRDPVNRRFRVRDPSLLLEAWRAAARFESHRILKGHVPARSGEALLRLVAQHLAASGMDAAATGLGAAWLYDHFAMFRLATLFVRQWPTAGQLEALGFNEEPSGANCWLVLPNDDGVFEGATDVEGVRCVHPVQVIIDLKGHPERAAEAAEHLKAHALVRGPADAG